MNIDHIKSIQSYFLEKDEGTHMKSTIRETAKSLGIGKNSVKVRSFEIIIDEPKSAGGTNEAPTPVEYMLASLVGCFNVTARVVAREMGIEVYDLVTDVEGTMDVDENFSGPGKLSIIFTNIKLAVSLDSSATKEQVDELLKEAEKRCGVSRTLKVQVPIQIGLK